MFTQNPPHAPRLPASCQHHARTAPPSIELHFQNTDSRYPPSSLRPSRPLYLISSTLLHSSPQRPAVPRILKPTKAPGGTTTRISTPNPPAPKSACSVRAGCNNSRSAWSVTGQKRRSRNHRSLAETAKGAEVPSARLGACCTCSDLSRWAGRRE
jgi:hypothetical protein